MNLKIFLSSTCIAILSTFTLFAQPKTDCNKLLTPDYISEGQIHTMSLNNSNTGRVYISFLGGFQYRLVICSAETKTYKINIYDIEKKLLFSGSCDNFTKSWDFSFKTTLACIAEIKVEGSAKSGSTFNIMMGFKDVKPKAKTNLKKDE